MPARRLGFGDRGQIKEGFAADLTIFDPQTIIDCATSAEPAKAPLGIDRVLVGGIETVKAGQLTGHAEGKFLKHE
jgi:N-acyl-D-amino-acid deacylase